MGQMGSTKMAFTEKTGKGKEGKEKEKTGGEEKEKDDTQQKCRGLGKEDGAADFSKTERE